MLRRILSCAALLALTSPAVAEAPPAPGGEGGPLSTGLAVVPPDFSEVTVVSGLASPTALAMAPDGRRIYVDRRDTTSAVTGER